MFPKHTPPIYKYKQTNLIKPKRQNVKEMHIFKKIEKIVKLGVHNRKMLWYYMGVLHRANRSKRAVSYRKGWLFTMLLAIVVMLGFVALFFFGAVLVPHAYENDMTLKDAFLDIVLSLIPEEPQPARYWVAFMHLDNEEDDLVFVDGETLAKMQADSTIHIWDIDKV
jgi:hypothetical protein